MKRKLIILPLVALALSLPGTAISAGRKALRNDLTIVAGGGELQTRNLAGNYIYKNYRKGKGGFENHLEITNAARGRLHLSFEGTYFFMAGKDETFHEGSGEGDGQLNGDIVTATLNDGAGGTCRVTLTVLDNQLTDERTITVRSVRCALNVSPDGVYRRDASKRSGQIIERNVPRAAVTSVPAGAEVCPDPRTPCHSAARKFAANELPFHLPAQLRKGRTYSSAPFYAVIIKTYEDEACDADGYTSSIERERLRLQKIYPTRKVFGAYNCPDLDAVSYSFPGRLDAGGERVLVATFIAVFAGNSAAEAKEFLTYVRTTFSEAVLKRMTASYEIIDQ
jgi:hypothetical protein